MKKTISAILLCLLAVSSAFSQITIEFKLGEDHPQDEYPLVINDQEQGRFFVRMTGEPDGNGATPVELALENSSYTYNFRLFDHAWNKKQLKKEHIYLEKGYVGESTSKVENIRLTNEDDIHVNERYTFPVIIIEEGKTFECKIPIHLIKPKPGLFNKKRQMLHSHIDCTISISVDTRDKLYETLSSSCDALRKDFDDALAEEEFCTHLRHPVSFEQQTEDYTDAIQDLRNQINRPLLNNGWPKNSKKYKRYQELLTILDEMDDDLETYKSQKHYCVSCDRVKNHSCGYCKMSLEQIYNRLNSLYQKLYVGEVKKQDILKEVKGLYNCCTASTCAQHAKQWKNSEYKTGITDFYNKIMNY